MSKKLSDWVPREFRGEFYDTPAAKLLDIDIVQEYRTSTGVIENTQFKPWPGKHKNVHFWVLLANGKAVAWNENPAVGWSFPVITVAKSPKSPHIVTLDSAGFAGRLRYTCISTGCSGATCLNQPYMGYKEWEEAKAKFFAEHPCDPDDIQRLGGA